MQYNVNNPAVKRILREVKEMEAEPSDQYHANPLEDNIFEWHFTIRGPKDTEFEGGLYHGRIILPPEYPFKPPNIVLLNESGRFEVGTKICLSISSYHPEHWQPSWSIRTVLVALISFMPTKGDGAIGAIDMPAKDRKELARKTPSFLCEKCGKRMCDILSPAEIGATSTEAPANTTTSTTTTTTTTSTTTEPSPQPQNTTTTTTTSTQPTEPVPTPSALQSPPAVTQTAPANQSTQPTTTPIGVPPNAPLLPTTAVPPSQTSSLVPTALERIQKAQQMRLERLQQMEAKFAQTQPAQPQTSQPAQQQQAPQQQTQQPQVQQAQQVRAATNPSGTTGLDFIIVALFVAIIALLAKKFYGL